MLLLVGLPFLCTLCFGSEMYWLMAGCMYVATDVLIAWRFEDICIYVGI